MSPIKRTAAQLRCPTALLAALVAALLLAVPAGASVVVKRIVGVRATSISASDGDTCASLSNRSVDCWGQSYLPKETSGVPERVPGVSGATAVQASIRYNCALLHGGRIECWGDDGYGQLGNGKTQDSVAPVKVRGIANATAISAGGYHACALLATGSVYCWGRNVRGALGDGSLADSSLPVPVHGITNAAAISAGYIDDETCAVLKTGAVDCWGANSFGQLGDGNTKDSSTPVRVIGLSTAVAVAAAGGHACAVLRSGEIECWGENREGQLGNGTRETTLVPVPVTGISDGVAIAVDPRGYSCAVRHSGSVYCWGHNPYDQLGNGRQPEGSLVPVEVLDVSGAVSVTTGYTHACALLSTGGADCWGHDGYGQLGTHAGPGDFNAMPVLFGESPRERARSHGPHAFEGPARARGRHQPANRMARLSRPRRSTTSD
ncbi:MAG TPA: hypothetical protein VGX51_01100 [Solirubrobacteraceae bacterium]|nr:hypothetical protein [Solirubrobacteraceae bacterium]